MDVFCIFFPSILLLTLSSGPGLADSGEKWDRKWSQSCLVWPRSSNGLKLIKEVAHRKRFWSFHIVIEGYWFRSRCRTALHCLDPKPKDFQRLLLEWCTKMHRFQKCDRVYNSGGFVAVLEITFFLVSLLPVTSKIRQGWKQKRDQSNRQNTEKLWNSLTGRGTKDFSRLGSEKCPSL